MTFAEKMRELRDAKGLSETKLADLSGVPFGTVHEYGLGRRKPSFAAVIKLAKALDVDCTAFAACTDLTDSEKPTEEPKPVKPSPTKKGGKK
ncbi:helix-turn-helix domain-containing protein [Frigoriglobus tundricola]|uniref:HTH cro/C1-type domain-containing protein n=1 Tax=Frigoriglobus tundricola TaxID=2774151 RepID=A0A6M5Z493_9BACT|nr:helix-turn-helix transcriptional regulator [Frigoriglobus tundricola]QJX01228.1 hypothetical protein FTUN_8867 [Frigoriglobus tundricola]